MIDCAEWYLRNFVIWHRFLADEAKSNPWKKKDEKDPPPLLHRVVEQYNKHGLGMQLRLTFIVDTSDPLIKCLNFAQSDRPIACFLYDELMNLSQVFAFSHHGHRKILPPKPAGPPLCGQTVSPLASKRRWVRRPGDCGSGCLLVSNAQFFRDMFGRVHAKLHESLTTRFTKSAAQIDFFRQLRVLNPNNLPDMSCAVEDYPALDMHPFQVEFMEYLRSQKRDISGPEDLLQWWKAHPSSSFRDRVLFLVSSPVSSAAAERLFSMCGQLDPNQWAMSQNRRRLEFMLQFNGDTVEERFV